MGLPHHQPSWCEFKHLWHTQARRRMQAACRRDQLTMQRRACRALGRVTRPRRWRARTRTWARRRARRTARTRAWATQRTRRSACRRCAPRGSRCRRAPLSCRSSPLAGRRRLPRSVGAARSSTTAAAGAAGAQVGRRLGPCRAAAAALPSARWSLPPPSCSACLRRPRIFLLAAFASAGADAAAGGRAQVRRPGRGAGRRGAPPWRTAAARGKPTNVLVVRCEHLLVASLALVGAAVPAGAWRAAAALPGAGAAQGEPPPRSTLGASLLLHTACAPGSVEGVEGLASACAVRRTPSRTLSHTAGLAACVTPFAACGCARLCSAPGPPRVAAAAAAAAAAARRATARAAAGAAAGRRRRGRRPSTCAPR